MKITDMYRKFLEEKWSEFKDLLLGFVKAIRDASELLPDEEVIASWKIAYPEMAGIVSAKINGANITFCTDVAKWTYQFEGKNYYDAVNEYLKKHYGDNFYVHKDSISTLASKTGTDIKFSICFDVPFDERDKFSGVSWSKKFHEDFTEFVNDIKECLSDEAVKFGVSARDPSEKFYSGEIELFFEQQD